ncbi:EAL domain-containing protein [Ornithinibacillus sp. FSL M8-0202]|uniref:bifunctional diguanylate cyclase/phosphodiesterase n=1 Tax=Ornithinibacillus sp. FSL M8-0202 TaxID=2921616 RepID=UPI0030D4F931
MMHSSYSPILTTFSVIIFILSIYTSFILVERIFDGLRSHKIFWIIAGAFVMATGLFSFHFIVIIAHHISFPLNYNLEILIVSFLFALMSSFAAFLTLYVSQLTKAKACLSVFIMASGIFLLHYSAILAMNEPLIIQFSSLSFGLTIVLAFVFAILTVMMFKQIRHRTAHSFTRAGGNAILLGITISALQYVGIGAIEILPHVHNERGPTDIDTFTLGIILSSTSSMIIIVTLCIAWFDYRSLQKQKQLINQNKHSEMRYRDLVEFSPEPLLVHDGKRILFANDICIKCLRASNKNEIIGKPLKDFIHPDYQRIAKQHVKNLPDQKQVDFIEMKFVALDGSLIDAEIKSYPIVFEHKPAIQLIVRDITEQKKVRRELEDKQQRYSSLFDNNPDPVFLLNADGIFQDINTSGGKLIGYTKEDLLQMSYQEVVDTAHLDVAIDNFKKTISGKPQAFEVNVKARNGSSIPVNITTIPITIEGEITGIFGISKDLTKEKQALQQIKHLAYTDQLTGLPNRRWFNQHLSEVINRSEEYPNSLAILVIDFDDFKDINDLLGHHMGDTFLKHVAKKLQNSVREQDQIARIGGDEFIITLENVTKAEAEQVAERILDVMNQPVDLAGNDLIITLSIGISILHNCSIEVETLIKQADLAMYLAKQKGKNNYQFYNDQLNEKVKRRLYLENALRKSIENDELTLYYQPQIELSTRKLVGLEALLRWNLEDEQVSPAEFIPIAEKTGLIVPIGEWILREACRQIGRWKDHPYLHVPVSVNVSARQLVEPSFTKRIYQILMEESIDPKYLKLEITESVMMDIEDSTSIVNELQALGLKIAIDDFGTGYSSLHLITSLDFETLKIDKTLVDIHNTRKMRVLKAIIQSIDRPVVIEGIETEEEYQVLKDFNAIGQGYYFASPLPPEQL